MSAPAAVAATEVVDTLAAGPVRRLACTDRIVGTDPAQYLECRQRQLLAHLAAASPAADLLGAAALGSTREYYRHCALLHRPRWTLLQDLARDDDLVALGFEPARLPSAGAGELPLLLELAWAGHPVHFYAPSADLPYWAGFLRSRGKADGGGRDHHNVMVCGASLDGRHLLAVDSANPEQRFRPELLAVDQMLAAVAADPQGWFVDCLALRPGGPPHPGHFVQRFRAMLDALDDGFEAYAALPDLLRADRDSGCDPEEVCAGLDLLRMLAGSRANFHRFLRRTGHVRPAAAYRDLAATLALLLGRARGYVIGDAATLPPALARALLCAGAAEVAALALLRREAATGPTTLDPAVS